EEKDITNEIPFKIPQKWEWVRLENISINYDGKRVPLSLEQRKNLKKIYDYYGATGVIDKVEKYIFDRPLLLIGEDGANLKSRTKPLSFIASGKYWVNNHAHVLDSINIGILNYLKFYINNASIHHLITGSAQPKLTQSKLSSLFVPLPSLDEQIRIVKKLEAIQNV
ncbi:restriction endonuclease subunit S, partial [Macrococcoides caseolyticum]|uniref:restriction endonuclease subunit S n=1 Tax=Macrococcoides caseolyticum TaxID=69966 RepID=UPI001F472F29